MAHRFRICDPFPELKQHDVHVWLADVQQWQPAEFEPILSDDEIKRARRFRKPEHQTNAIVQRGILRSLLAGYLKQNPREIGFQFTGSGRPFIEKCELDFNVSHSGNWFALAVTRGRMVGIDIETREKIVDVMGLAGRYFSSESTAILLGMAEELQVGKFFHLWSAHEACLKATGEGIAGGLEGIQLVFDKNQNPIRSTGHKAECTIAMIDMGAVAVMGDWNRALQMFELRP